MNRSMIAALAGVAFLSIAACEEKKEPAPADTKSAAPAPKTDAAAPASSVPGKAMDAAKDLTNKAGEAAKDAAAKGAEAVKSTWEATKTAFITDGTKTFEGYKTQFADLGKKVEALPAPVKDTAKKIYDEVGAKITEGEKMLTSLKGSSEADWKGVTEKFSALLPSIKDGLSKLTGLISK